MNRKLLEKLILAFIESEIVQFTVQFFSDLMNVLWAFSS